MPYNDEKKLFLPSTAFPELPAELQTAFEFPADFEHLAFIESARAAAVAKYNESHASRLAAEEKLDGWLGDGPLHPIPDDVEHGLGIYTEEKP